MKGIQTISVRNNVCYLPDSSYQNEIISSETPVCIGLGHIFWLRTRMAIKPENIAHRNIYKTHQTQIYYGCNSIRCCIIRSCRIDWIETLLTRRHVIRSGIKTILF